MVSSTDFIEPADWTRRQQKGQSEAWLCLYQQAWIEGYVYGRNEEWNDMIVNLLMRKFGTIDEKLEELVDLLQRHLATSHLSALLSFLSTLSREEFLNRFHSGNLMNDLGCQVKRESSLKIPINNLKDNKKYSTLQVERIGWQEGQQTGMTEERHDMIHNLLTSRFGTLDKEFEVVIKPLMDLPIAELSSLLLSLSTLSREELLVRFGQSTL